MQFSDGTRAQADMYEIMCVVIWRFWVKISAQKSAIITDIVLSLQANAGVVPAITA
jgi:hypothetical protein